MLDGTLQGGTDEQLSKPLGQRTDGQHRAAAKMLLRGSAASE